MINIINNKDKKVKGGRGIRDLFFLGTRIKTRINVLNIINNSISKNRRNKERR